MRKRHILLALLAFTKLICQMGSHDIMGGTQIKSPQSYAFEKYGNVPVNLYTGSIDLKIPIYSLNIDGGNTVDLFLSYDSSGFIPHKKSDLAGMNWSLIAGGRVTRTINRIADEYTGNPTSNGGNPYDLGLDLHGFLTGVRANPYPNSTVYNLNSGAGGTTGDDWRLGSTANGYEGEPDMFNFNVLGLHGKFMVGNDGNVLVESDDPNVQVDLSGLQSYAGKGFCIPPSSQIVIKDGKGNKYYFGGSYSAFEIAYSRNSSGLKGDSYSGFPAINSWSISKVEFSNGKTVTFNYVPDTLASNFCHMLSASASSLTANAKLLSLESFFQDGASAIAWSNCPGGWLGGCETIAQSGGTSTWNYILLKKSLLQSIVYGDTQVQINYKDQGYPIVHFDLANIYFNEHVLDNIQIKYKNNIIQTTALSYTDYGSTNKRPFLTSILETPANKQYTLEYYNTSNFPVYYTKGIDHWGYWNGNDSNDNLAPVDTYNASTGDYTLNNTVRDAKIPYHNVGLLSKIIYPTKGYSVFEYEPQTYGKRLERTSASSFLPTLTDNTGLAGGARVKRRYDYSENGGLTNDKSYQYTTVLNGSVSSGILMNWPRYLYYIQFQGPGYNESRMIRSSSNVQQNSLDSYNIGYSKVFEIDNNKGYTEHSFTSYQDTPDVLSPDTSNLRTYGGGNYQSYPENLWKNFKNLYGNDKSILRGKPLTDKIYDNSGNILKQVEYQYNDNINYNINSTKDDNNYVAIHHLSTYWVQGYKKYFNTPTLKKKIITDYFNGSPVVNSTEYYYDSNSHLNLSREINNLSGTDVVSKSYVYAQDYINNALMISKNMIGVPLEVTSTQTIGTTSKTLSKMETVYPTSLPTTQAGNLVSPLFVKSYDISNLGNTPLIEVTYDKYDSKGNLQQYTTKDGISTTIIWGYNNTQPIAKIEGAKLSDIQQSFIDSIVNASDTDAIAAPNNDETSFLSVLNTFRNNLPNYLVSTYTYDPLIGVRSIFPPSGIGEIYIYDIANRLKEIRQQEKDINGNMVYKVVKEFKYNYKN